MLYPAELWARFVINLAWPTSQGSPVPADLYPLREFNLPGDGRHSIHFEKYVNRIHQQ
jgi:hypothetical protein